MKSSLDVRQPAWREGFESGAGIGAGVGAAAGGLTKKEDIDLGEPVWK